jgi:hypothetical protein
MKHVLFIISVLVVLTGCVKVLPQGAAPISSLRDTEARYSQFAAENGYNHISNETNIRLISALPDKVYQNPLLLEHVMKKKTQILPKHLMA